MERERGEKEKLILIKVCYQILNLSHSLVKHGNQFSFSLSFDFFFKRERERERGKECLFGFSLMSEGFLFLNQKARSEEKNQWFVSIASLIDCSYPCKKDGERKRWKRKERRREKRIIQSSLHGQLVTTTIFFSPPHFNLLSSSIDFFSLSLSLRENRRKKKRRKKGNREYERVEKERKQDEKSFERKKTIQESFKGHSYF